MIETRRANPTLVTASHIKTLYMGYAEEARFSRRSIHLPLWRSLSNAITIAELVSIS
ncbi:hypothetical protein NITGR_590077 [Nitrospina gracilis 3/211]|uniref:Uncharacterized protein n=1 Tax=Nitrospina gracilis (strain 3/211) TaxID=1266370 RepID=M1ZCU7_NITG3|nr:hypothetical protein NITGR_590077 [Nitrospina gracilis 3/211]